jgi:hypothetical protein
MMATAQQSSNPCSGAARAAPQRANGVSVREPRPRPRRSLAVAPAAGSRGIGAAGNNGRGPASQHGRGTRWRCARLASAARGHHYDPGGAAARRGSSRTRLLPVRRPDRPVVRGEEGPLQRQLLLCFALAPVRACEGGLGLIERSWLPCKLRLSFCGSSKKSPLPITLMAGASAGLGGL